MRSLLLAIALVAGIARAAPSPYQLLWSAAQRYRKIAARGGWSSLPAGPDLRLGDVGANVARLRRRLLLSGELRANRLSRRMLFDEDLRRALLLFQRNHSLPASGELDPETWQALNVPVQVRLQTLQANLDRWRELPAYSGERYVLVDIAGFQVRLYEKGKVRLSMRAIVGETGMETPIFHSAIRRIVLNPWWEIPHEIAAEEALPEFQNDPKQPKRNRVQVYRVRRRGHLELVDPEKVDWKKVDKQTFHYVLRQAPGGDNPLGTMKFLFDNPYSVFLHGTTERGMFEASSRAISHGCVRVEKPLQLALALLQGGGSRAWSEPKLLASLKGGKTQAIALPAPVPIYFSYWTAWADEGGVQFRPDVYGWDEWDGQVVAELLHGRGVTLPLVAE